jgi:hypothetical protein
MPAMPTATPFLPSRHGFPFPNWFPPGTPVLTIPTPFGRIPIGNAGGGVCGGMVFASLDLHSFSIDPPAEPSPPVFAYLCRRLLASFDLPGGVLKYYNWQRRPAESRLVAGDVWPGVTALTVEREWPQIQALLDAGLPAPLGLVKAHSFDPRQLGKNHQVLACGYDFDEAAGKLTIRVYDPNYPRDDGVTLSLDVREPQQGRPVIHSREGPSVRGFFLTPYRRPLDPPPFAG